MITIDQYLCFVPYLSFLKKVVYNQLYDYFTKNKLFHDNQYGFRTKHTIKLAVTELIDRVLLNIDDKHVPFAVFMYFSMVHSHLSYSLLTWGFDSNRIVKLQKRCVRITTRSKYNAHTQPLLKQLNILSVPDMLLLNSMKFYYKYKHKEVPGYLPPLLYTHKAQLTTTTLVRETISEQIERVSISLKNVFGIICRKR